MNLDRYIEVFIFGASSISCLYHIGLYIHQRDRFLLLYANYLFSVSLFLWFRLETNYLIFQNNKLNIGIVFDEPLLLYMLVSYVLFITRVIDINNNVFVVKLTAYSFYVFASLLFLVYLYKLLVLHNYSTSRDYFFYSKLILDICAFLGLGSAWVLRKDVFTRIIVFGGLVYAFFSLLTIISIKFGISFGGLSEYNLYFLGCFLDVLIFSFALGYRTYLISTEKIETQSLLILESEKNKALLDSKNKILLNEAKQQEVQMRINKELQDEVGASLSSIHVFAELANKVAETETQRAQEYLVKISLQSKVLMDNIGDIIWAANINETEAREALLIRIKNYAQEILHPHKIVCTYIVSESYYSEPADKEFLKTTIKDIKYAMKALVAKEGTKRVTIKIEKEKVVIVSAL